MRYVKLCSARGEGELRGQGRGRRPRPIKVLSTSFLPLTSLDKFYQAFHCLNFSSRPRGRPGNEATIDGKPVQFTLRPQATHIHSSYLVVLKLTVIA